jgi:glycosyltransferase involved in cell wall biosynthesis
MAPVSVRQWRMCGRLGESTVGAGQPSVKPAGPRVVMVVNRDAFFLSHRLPLARGAREAGMDVIIVAGETGEGRVIEDEGFRFIALPITRDSLNPFVDARTVWFLARLYRRLQPTLLHHSTVKPLVYGSLAARLSCRAAAVVNTVSGLGYAFTSNHRTARMLRPALRRLWRAALSHPRSHTIFQNPDDRDDFVRMRLVRPERTVLIRGSGVDCGVFRPEPEPEGAPVVVLPARMLWDKGVAEFVEAARLLRAAGNVARFVLIGSPDLRNREAIPEGQLQAWSQEGVVEWWGHRTDMPSVLAGAAVVVLPTYGEGLPKVLLEAAAAGRPVVATDVRGCREVVRPGVNGLLVPPKDSAALAHAIGRLLRSPDLRATLGQGGRHLAECEFAEPVVVEQTLAVYRQLLTGLAN